MKALWNRFKSRDLSFLVLAFFVPLILLWLIFISLKVYPFGDNSVLVLDLNGQYVYFFDGFRQTVKEGGSLLYSWSRALGGEFMGIFAYYLSSPFTFLTLLFSRYHITEALLMIILCKVGSIGATTAFYLHRTHRSSKLKVIIFSTVFALSSYTIVYGHNLMWLDALIWLPLITYGLEELIKRRRFKLFTVSLAMGVMANFYIGYMLCIYVVLYMIYYYVAKSENGENNFWDEKKHFIKTVGRTAFFSLIAVGLAAWIILPTWYSLQFGKTEFSDPSFAFKQKFDFLDLLAKFMYGSYDTVRPEGLPVVFCSVLTIILAPLYFFSPKVRRREKAAGAVMIAVFVLSFNGSTIDLIWHGLQRPNWLNYRYSFMLIFLLVVFAYRAFDSLREIDFRFVAGVTVTWALITLIIQKADISFVSDLDNVWATLGCLLIFSILLYAVKNDWLGNGSVLILAVVVAVELFTSGLLNANSLDEDVTISSRKSYVTFIDKLDGIIDEVKESDGSFYRMEKEDHRKTNDPFALGFYGLSNSTSTLNQKQIDFLNEMGYSSKSHWSKYLGGTPVSDSLLGVKYVIFNSLDHEDFGTLYRSDEENGKFAYLNDHVLSVAFASSDAIYSFDHKKYETPFEYMNAMVGRMLGEAEDPEIFTRAEILETKKDDLRDSYISGHRKYEPLDADDGGRLIYTVQNKPGKVLYCFFPSEYPREVELMAGGRASGTFFGNETNRIVRLGRFDDDEVKVMLTLKDDNLYISEKSDFYFAFINEEEFDRAFAELKKGDLNITEHSDTRLYGTIDVPTDMSVLFTSIPYDACWQVKVDGQKAKTREAAGALLSISIAPGEHTVELKYVSAPFNKGCVITAGAAALFAVCVIVSDRLKVRRNKRWREDGV